jgi:hypothetical protein
MVQRVCELFVRSTVHPITRIVEEQYPDLLIGGQAGKPRALASECLALLLRPPVVLRRALLGIRTNRGF